MNQGTKHHEQMWIMKSIMKLGFDSFIWEAVSVRVMKFFNDISHQQNMFSGKSWCTNIKSTSRRQRRHSHILLFTGTLLQTNKGRTLTKHHICAADCFMFSFLSILVTFDGLLLLSTSENLNFKILSFKYSRSKMPFETHTFMTFVITLQTTPSKRSCAISDGMPFIE